MEKTILDELKNIAKQCKTSDEFTERAKNYLHQEKKIQQDIMPDSLLRDIFRKEEYKIKKEKAWEKLDNTILPMLKQREDCKGLWYECWIDLDECWLEKWFASFQYMSDKEIVEVCAKYLNEQERYYSSPNYIDALNKMVEDAEFEDED